MDITLAHHLCLFISISSSLSISTLTSTIPIMVHRYIVFQAQYAISSFFSPYALCSFVCVCARVIIVNLILSYYII